MVLLLFAKTCVGEAPSESRPGMQIAERLVKTLPNLPNVIHSQMEGKPEELRNMISQMLGDGLISQLVVNPLGVAEGMGVSLSDLGINKTDVQGKFGGNGNYTLLADSLFPFATTAKPTTEKVMYLDGVPIKDFDQFVRNRNLEGRFSTKKPATTTTPVPSANDIAAAVLDKLKVSIPYSQTSSAMVPRPPTDSASSQTLDLTMVDPSRIQEVNTLLRRAPQKFDNPATLFGGPPDAIVSSLDPEVNEVVTTLRTGNAMNVERIRELQNILQGYEQSLQTKELIAKRKQLQLLQNELVEQRKKIEEQRKMEEELRKKEQELEDERKAMEVQLQQQLAMWHQSFSSSRDPISPSTLPLNLAEYQTEKRMENNEGTVIGADVNQFWPSVVSSSGKRPAPSITAESQSEISAEDSDEFISSCQCQTISLHKMRGRWSMALASKTLIDKVKGKVRKLLPNEPSSQLVCGKMNVLTPKMSDVAQDARISLDFRTTGSKKLHREKRAQPPTVRTIATTKVALTIYVFMSNILAAVSCPVFELDTRLPFLPHLSPQFLGPCREAALLVRNVDSFFDNENADLVTYLKNKISKGDMDSMDIVPFSSEC
ncbi:unnamed protein product [Nippostrongylus brasiliensis]|uniref:Bromodomain-containing protein n=1 Tax=Nippostrongylus brasiliensis TaxID=27835 RepID=A0A0N4XVH5_NIPBR|nr:unnamed protein product [Nippostrongylus brasiliensis]